MIPMKLWTLNSYCFQILILVKVTEVVLASHPFDADHDPSLSVAYGTMVDGQIWYLQSALFRENSLDGGI